MARPRERNDPDVLDDCLAVPSITNRVGLIAAAAVLALAAGCSSAPDPAPFTVPSAPSPTPAAAVAQTQQDIEVFGPRVELPGGLLLKQLGKVFQYGGPEDTDPNTWAVRMVIDSIEVDPKCDQYQGRGARGHTLLISLRVETSALLTPTEAAPSWVHFQTIGPDGVSEAAGSTGVLCHTAKTFPIELRPSAKYRGEIAIDTSSPTGQLVYADAAVWNYPA